MGYTLHTCSKCLIALPNLPTSHISTIISHLKDQCPQTASAHNLHKFFNYFEKTDNKHIMSTIYLVKIQEISEDE